MTNINYASLAQQAIASGQLATAISYSTQYAENAVFDTTAKEVLPQYSTHPLLPAPPVQLSNNQGQHGNCYSGGSQHTILRRNSRRNKLNDIVAHVKARPQLPKALIDPHKVEIVHGIVDYHFKILDKEKRNQIIDEADNNARAELRSRYCIPEPDCIVEYISDNKNCYRCEALLALAKRLGLQVEYIFNSYPQPANDKQKHNDPIRHESAEGPMHERDIVVRIPPRLIVDGQVYTLTHRDRQEDMRGVTEQMICSYTAKHGEDFVLVASRVKEEDRFFLKIGFTAPKAQLFSRKMIDCNRTATIVLPLDMEVSLLLRRFARQQRLLEGTNIIISGFYDGEDALAALHLKELAGRSVVLIAKAGYKGLQEVGECAQACLQAKASSVKMYLGAVVADSTQIPNVGGLHTSWEKAHWGKTIDLSKVCFLENLVPEICHQAVLSTEYQRWMAEMGLNVKELSAKVEHGTVFRMRSLAEIPDSPALTTELASVSAFFQSVYTTLIWGFSNVGKSWFVAEIVLALITRTCSFFLSADSPELPRNKICYVDGELGGEELKRRIAQLLASRNFSMSDIEDHVWIITAMTDRVELFNPAWQEWFIERLSSEGFTHVFFDNINALMPDAPKGNLTPLIDIVSKIKRGGIAVTLLHHATKDGKDFTGTGKLGDLTQNQIRLDGRKQILEDGECSPALEAALGEAGPLVRATVVECKCAPQLQGRSTTFVLPVGGTWQHIEGNLGCCARPVVEHKPVPDAREAASEVSAHVYTVAEKLTPNEQKVLSCVQQADCTRKEVEDALGFKTRTAGNILTKLVELGLIQMLGHGKGAYYSAA